MAPGLITSDPNARPKHFRNIFEECLFVFMVMMATASTTFLQGVIVINTATIGRDLIMTPAQITWISAALGLASGSFMLFFGKTADLFGCKLQLLCGMAFLSLTSLATAFAPNPIAMNIFCGFLGLGTAVIAPPAIGSLFATYPEGRRRNKATGALGCGNPLGFILGSVSSGIATKYYSWRASFIVIAIFFAIMTISSFWTMPSTPRAGSLRSEVRRFDYLGTALTVVGIGLVSAGLTEGPDLGWKSRQVIIMLIFGVVCLFGFAFWEDYYRFPLLNPVVWKNKTYTLCVLCVFFGYMSFITNMFWISLYMQEVQHLSPLTIAVRLLPQALVGFIWSYIGQALVSKISGRSIMGIGGIGYLVGAILQFFVRQNTSYWMFLFPSLCITVIGADFQFIVSNLYINKQMPTQSSLAAGVLQTAMRVSISIGLAISSAVYVSVAQTPEGRANVNLPFERAYLCSIMFAATSLTFVLFMKIGTQGKKSPSPSITGTTIVEEERPRTAGEYSDYSSTEHRPIRSNKASQISLWSSATAGSVDSFFRRWSWEPEIIWPDDRYLSKSSNVVFEVCVKCLEERKVIVQTHPIDGHTHEHHTLDPNPYRHIGENSYDDPNAPVVDSSPGSNPEATIIRYGVRDGVLSCAETLHALTNEIAYPAPSRVPSQRVPTSHDAPRRERSICHPSGNVHMVGSRTDPNGLDAQRTSV